MTIPCTAALHSLAKLLVRYGELKKVQRMSRPALRGNVSYAGEGALISMQGDCDEWTEVF